MTIPRQTDKLAEQRELPHLRQKPCQEDNNKFLIIIMAVSQHLVSRCAVRDDGCKACTEKTNDRRGM